MKVKNRKTGKEYSIAAPDGGHGSGIKISSDGLILTAQHVVDGANTIVVKIPASRKVYPATVVYENKKWDVAFLVIEGTHKFFTPLPETPPPLRVRQTAYAVGYPFHAHRKTAQSMRGIVSGISDNGDVQLGMSVNPGNSGGPLIDENEQILGLVVARGNVRAGVEGLAFAVPMSRVLKVYDVAKGKIDAARQSLKSLKQNDRLYADVVTELLARPADATMLDDAVRSFYGSKDSSLEKSLNEALKHADVRAEVLMVGCAYYWNASIVFYDSGDEQWRRLQGKSSDLCARAKKSSSQFVAKSPFIITAARDKQLVTSYRLENSRSGRTRRAVKKGGFAVGAFAMGMSKADATTACERRGKMTNEGGEAHCHETPEVGDASAVSELSFCEDKLCRIDWVTRPSSSDGDVWTRRYAELRARLESAYGKASKTTTHLPDACRSTLVPCLQQGRSFFRHEWRLEERGVRVRLEMGRASGEAVLRVVHVSE